MKIMRIASTVGLALTLSVLMLGTPALADNPPYVLNVDYCSGGCLFGGTGGTVNLTQVTTGEVLVTVTLGTNLDFHDEGLTSFVFNVSGDPTVTISNVSNSTDWTQQGTTHEDGAGTFDYGLNCKTCGPSANDIGLTTLSFDVSATGLTVGSFNVLSSGGSPDAYFGATVFNTTNGSCTGVIGSDGTGTPKNGGSNNGTGPCTSGGTTTVPEPAAISLLGGILLVLGNRLRKRLA